MLWQDFEAAAEPAPWTDTYPAVMPDGLVLRLPIRDTAMSSWPGSSPIRRALRWCGCQRRMDTARGLERFVPDRNRGTSETVCGCDS